MSLSGLTDKEAVLRAIEEFDALGRGAFLARYGFGQARSYFLLYRGARYDSKAIAGVAHGYQHPTIGPLKSGDFSGGENTVAKRLRDLGFEITTTGYPPRPPKEWALCANPNRYRIYEAVNHLETDLWTIGRSDVREGDRAAIWQTRDKKGQRGVVAFGEIITNPRVCVDSENPYWVDPEDGKTEQARVLVRYSSAPNLPLWVNESPQGEFLCSLSVARSQGGTAFHVTPEQWSRLIDFAGEWSAPTDEEIDASERLRHRSKRAGGQGFGLSAKERRAVENHAMAVAKQHLQEYWDEVRDVSASASFDLLCRDRQQELRVEVKGTTSTGEKVVLTKGEVREAEQPDYAMFVVTEIQLERSEPDSPKAYGGECTYFSPWQMAAHQLEPISYACRLNWETGTRVPMPSSGEES